MQKLIEFLEQQPAGYKAELAAAINRHPSYFSRQLSGDRSFTVQDCIGIEKHTTGQVRCEDILPDVDWAYLRRSVEAAA
jgi:DNA-binding transcriptional regulator YdaS (Cro superfamily)